MDAEGRVGSLGNKRNRSGARLGYSGLGWSRSLIENDPA